MFSFNYSYLFSFLALINIIESPLIININMAAKAGGSNSQYKIVRIKLDIPRDNIPAPIMNLIPALYLNTDLFKTDIKNATIKNKRNA